MVDMQRTAYLWDVLVRDLVYVGHHYIQRNNVFLFLFLFKIFCNLYFYFLFGFVPLDVAENDLSTRLDFLFVVGAKRQYGIVYRISLTNYFNQNLLSLLCLFNGMVKLKFIRIAE